MTSNSHKTYSSGKKKGDKCSPLVKKIVRIIHFSTFLVFIIGAYLEVRSIQEDQKWSIYLPLVLLLMVAMTIPSQICVGLNDKDGWLSVGGSVISLCSYIVIIVLTIKKKKEEDDKKQNT
jgi:cell division protein FtsW (lipid II flippase)